MEKAPHILIIDDDYDYCSLFGRMISEMGYSASWTTDPSDVYPLLEKLNPSCVFLDLMFPRVDGLTVLKKIKKFRRKIPVIMLTGHESVKTAVEAIKEGALDYLVKPLKKEGLKAVLTRALREDRVAHEVQKVKGDLDKVKTFEDFRGLSERIEEFIQIELEENKTGEGNLSASEKSSRNIVLPKNLSLPEASHLAVHHIEKRWIRAALERAQWKKGKAARILGIDTKTLYLKMKSYGLESSITRRNESHES